MLASPYTNSEVVGYRAAWKHYVRGGVGSESTAQLIRSYLQVCNANRTHEDEEEEADQCDFAGAAYIPNMPVSVKKIHDIIESMQTRKENKENEDHSISTTLVRSVKLGAAMWELREGEAAGTSAVDKTCYTPLPKGPEPADADSERPLVDVLSQRRPEASLRSRTVPAKFQAWKSALFKSRKPPTTEQWNVLHAIYVGVRAFPTYL